MEKVIIGLALLFFTGHALQWVFVKTKVPDLLILILAGFLIGPSGFGLIQMQNLGQAGAVIAQMTLIIILYEGGLNLNWKSLVGSSLPALGLSLLSFLLIALVSALFVSLFFPLPTAALVGLGIGSTSSAIVFPLIKPLALKEKTKTILSLESAFTDVFAIIAFLSVLEMAASGSYSVSSLLFGFGAKPFLSMGLGAGSALLWAALKKLFPQMISMSFAGEAWSLLTYGLIEWMDLNGPIGILVFGFALANLSLLPRPAGALFSLSPVTDKEMSLLKEVSFLLRTLFFLYLGVIMQLAAFSVFAWAAGLTALIFATRYAAVRGALRFKKFGFFDSLMACGMGPRGLACAVLATLPLSKGLENGLWMQNVIFYVVFLSILVTSAFVIFGPFASFQNLFRDLFPPDPEKAEGAEIAPPPPEGESGS